MLRLLRFQRLRRGFVTICAVALIAPAISTAPASAANGTIADAEARVTAAQREANDAAEAFDGAQSKFYQLDDDERRTRAAIALLSAEKEALVEIVQARAVALYEQSPLQLDVLGDGGDVLVAARRSVLVAAANANSDQAISRLHGLSDDLRFRESTLRSQLKAQRETVQQLKEQEAELQSKLLDAQRAAQELREQLAREQREREYQALLDRARAKAAADAQSSSSDSGNGSSGGSAGQIIVSGNWVCPVQGSVSFSSTYGAPRGNGRTHKGVDMFAATGTPVVAVESGSVQFQSDEVGGNAAYVSGSNGTYYYAHLNDYTGGDRSVSAGEVIGHVGNTGNASGGPSHLHFEIRPGGAASLGVDPYPTVRSHC